MHHQRRVISLRVRGLRGRDAGGGPRP